jgi:hypothetical protein
MPCGVMKYTPQGEGEGEHEFFPLPFIPSHRGRGAYFLGNPDKKYEIPKFLPYARNP